MDRTLNLPASGFVWHELMTTDPAQAEGFSGRVVGLSVETVGEGPQVHRLISIGGQPVGGIVGSRSDGSAWPSGGPRPQWLPSFGVRDADDAASEAATLGGDVLLSPTDVPGIGRAAVLGTHRRRLRGLRVDPTQPIARVMDREIGIIGAPTSAGAFTPDQEGGAATGATDATGNTAATGVTAPTGPAALTGPIASDDCIDLTGKAGPSRS
jgi:uncharacterized protein